MTQNYRSEPARGRIIAQFFMIAWVASVFEFGAFAGIAALAGVMNVPILLLLIAGQNASFLTIALMMCAVYAAWQLPPLPPKEKIKEVSNKNKVTGNSEIHEIERIKTYRYQ